MQRLVSQASGYPRRQDANRAATILVVAGIALLALWLRWDRLQYAEFGIDQAWSINRAFDLVAKGDFPLVGIPSSAGLRQGAVEIYFLAIPVAISKDPLVATAFVGLLQTVAVVATFFFARRYFGYLEAIAAALLFAVNPWALHYGRKIWTQDLLPLFTVLFFAALYAALVDNRRRGIVLGFVCLAVMFFVHPQVVGYVPILVVATLLSLRRFGPRPLLLGSVLSAMVALPYVVYDLQNGWPNLTRLSALLTSGETETSLDGLRYVVAMASAAGFPDILDHTFRTPVAYPDIRPANALATLLLFLGTALCAWRAGTQLLGRERPQGNRWEKHLLPLLWFAIPSLVLVRHPETHPPHYYVYVLPAQYILIALGLVWVGRQAALLAVRARLPQRGVASGAFVVCLLAIVISQVVFFQTYLGHIANAGPRRPYGTPLLFSQRAVATLRELDAALGGPAVYVYAHIHRFALDYLARPDLKLHHVDPPLHVVLPRGSTSGYLAVLAADDAILAVDDYYATAEDGPLIPQLREMGFTELADRAVLGPDGFAYFRFFYLSPAGSARLLDAFGKPERRLILPNGMRLAGYALGATTRAGDEVELSLLWDLPQDHSRFPYGEYNLFVHAVDREGKAVAQRDWPIFQYKGWHVTDFVVTKHALEIPASYGGPALLWLDVGAYERYSRETVRLLDGEGKRTGEALKVGPIKVLPQRAVPDPQFAVGQACGDWLELQGYDLAQREASGDAVAVGLHWRALAKPPGDFVVSVQVLDANGRLVAQHDSPPAQGNYPTVYWDAGEVVLDSHPLLLPAGLPPGHYELQVVVYSATTQARLPFGARDRATLGAIGVGQ